MTDDAERAPRDDGETERETAYELLQRGHDLLTQRHFAQAAVVLERADRAEPGKGSILEALGRAYYNSGQHDRSRATFLQLLEIDPSSHYAHFALGQSLKQVGRRDEARTHLRLALALSPASKLYAGALARLGPAPSPAPTTDEPPTTYEPHTTDDQAGREDPGDTDDPAGDGAAPGSGGPPAADDRPAAEDEPAKTGDPEDEAPGD